jgi:hypothetical protein
MKEKDSLYLFASDKHAITKTDLTVETLYN